MGSALSSFDCRLKKVEFKAVGCNIDAFPWGAGHGTLR